MSNLLTERERDRVTKTKRKSDREIVPSAIGASRNWVICCKHN